MLYVYEQEFVEGGHVYRRRGVLAAVEAQPWETGAVKPHEYTMSGPKEDRLRLLQATGVQFSPVFCIARDRAGQLRDFIERTSAATPPTVTATSFEGDHHRFWAVEAGPYEMRQLAPLLAESFYIADGHHRYETAVNYRNWRLEQGPLPPDHPARFTMAAIVASEDPGLVIRPIHRLVPRPAPADWRQRLGDAFEVEHVERDAFTRGDRAGVHRILGRAAALELARGGRGFGRGMDAHVHPHALVAGATQQGRGEGAVHAATHRHEDSRAGGNMASEIEHFSREAYSPARENVRF
jgi:uncharacterized protein (DUF1015 family)